MTATTEMNLDYMKPCCPCWFPDVGDASSSDVSSSNWRNVTVYKKDDKGNFIASGGKPIEFKFVEEVSTGDLYWADKPSVVAVKCAAMALAAPFYTLGIMFFNMINIAVEAVSIAWEAIKRFGEEWKQSGCIHAVISELFRFYWEIPKSIAVNIWRIVRAPIYGIGIMFAGMYGIIRPYEGRALIGKMEKEWHDGATYRMDFRHGKNLQDGKDSCWTCEEIKAGKILFLGYCAQERGNLKDPKSVYSLMPTK